MYYILKLRFCSALYEAGLSLKLSHIDDIHSSDYLIDHIEWSMKADEFI